MAVLDILFPRRCVRCGTVGRYFCLHCQKTIRPVAFNESICPICERLAIDGVTHPRCRTRYSLDGLTSFFHYDGIIRCAVKALKYRFVSDLAREFVALVPEPSLQELRTQGCRGCVLVPVPLHRTRVLKRGFNQAEVLGRLFAERLHIPVHTDILYRAKNTTPQVEMKDRDKRLANMKNVFAIHNSLFPIHDSCFLLFDDVFTTGSTMREAANVLKRNGAKWVWAVTMAR